MSDIYYLQLKTNLGNTMVSADNGDNIFEIISVNYQPNSFISYKPIEINKYLYKGKSLKKIDIELLDNNNNQVNLNSIPYILSIKIEIIHNDSYKIPYTKDVRVEAGGSMPTNLDMIIQNPGIINKSSQQEPLSMNAYIELMNIQEMIEKENRREAKLKQKHKLLKNKK
jgi:hypothetical protein